MRRVDIVAIVDLPRGYPCRVGDFGLMGKVSLVPHPREVVPLASLADERNLMTKVVQQEEIA